MNNQYECFGRDLTVGCARKLIQELFKGQTVRRHEVIRRTSNDADAYYHRGLANIGLEEYEAAITDFDEAIRINPNDAHSYYNQGLVKFRLNRLSKAEEDLQIALQLSEQIDDAELIGNIRYLLYEINSRTVGGADE